ncbi:MAG: hypothetical protein LUD50_02755 [Clostridia bacterium]|nr:hypothetical protein [Clostridia bacterium]
MRDYKFLDEPIFTLEEAAEEFDTKGALYGALKRAMERREVKKLTGGLYCAVDQDTGCPVVDRFEIATKLRPGGYCAYHTALEYYGLAKPLRSEVQIVSSRQGRPVTIDGTEYKTYMCSYNAGIMESYWNAPVRVTDVERTIVDCLDRLDLGGGLQEVFRALCKVRYADEDKLLQYLEGYNLKFLYKKAGYILSVIHPSYLSASFIKLCQERTSSRMDDIRPLKSMPTVFSSDWNLYVPSYIAKKRSSRSSKAPDTDTAPLNEAPAEAEAPPTESSEQPPAEADVVPAAEAGAPAEPSEGTVPP